jgi:dephospho-CoA kinase
MIRVGLTGNVASGKSSVAGIWAGEGIPVVSADELAREAVAPGTPGLDEVRLAFGEGVVAADGTLDRGALRRRVFSDDEARARLEALLHPRIRTLRDRWMDARRSEGAPFVVAEIPLLFETGGERDFDVTVFVDAPDEERLRRLVSFRGIAEDEARRIMAAQMEPARKRALADHTLANDGSMEELRRAALALLDELRGGPGADSMVLDLHLHTLGSWDCLSDPRRLLERAASLGIDRIAITDHNRLHVALRMAEAFPDRVIPGEEVKTREGIDVIGLYLSEEIPKGTPAHETIQRVRAQGGIPYLPHPYASGKGGGGRYAEELAPLVDVVEVFNARLHPGRLNTPAEELARRHGKLRGAGSDAHTVGELGGARVEVPRHANTPEALLRALARGTVTGRTSSNLVHLASTWAKIRKKLPGPPTLEDGVPEVR